MKFRGIISRFLYRCLPYNFFTQKGNRLFGTIIYASVAHRALGARGGLAFCELNVLCRTVFRADSAADTLIRVDLMLICISHCLVINPSREQSQGRERRHT